LRFAGRADGNTLWLAHDRPVAFSLGGTHGVIVATDGLARHLGERGASAVLEHGRAHPTGRHHLVVSLANALRAVLACIPLFRQAPAALCELVELAADVAAIRKCGVPAVRAALLEVSACGAPDIALTMARDAVDVRLDRRAYCAPAPSRFRSAMTCWIAGVAAVVLPFLTAAAVLLSLMLITCPPGIPR
jgi:hypothetical protein